MLLMIFCLSTDKVQAQGEEAQQLLLDVEKLVQLKQLLADLKKGYEILFAGYSSIKKVSEGTFNLHKAFLDKLLDVSPAVKNYGKIPQIIAFQLALVKEYKTALRQYYANNQFTIEELEYIRKVYAQLLAGSIKNLDALSTVLTAHQLRMTDDERLSAIDGIHKDMQDKLTFLRYFHNKNTVLGLQRAKEQSEVNTLKKINKINH